MRQKNSLFLILFICLAMVLGARSHILAPSAASSLPTGVEAAANEVDTQTMYYLSLPINNKVCYLFDERYSFSANSFDFAAAKRRDNLINAINTGRKFTYIFVYNNIRAGDFALLTTWNVSAKAEKVGVFFDWIIKITFIEDIDINIRSSYYDYFINGNFNNVTITILIEGNGYLLKNENGGGYWTYSSSTNYAQNLTGAYSYKKEVPADYNELLNEGQIGDNGGTAADPISDSNFLNFIWSAFINLLIWIVEKFGGSVSFQMMERIVIVLGIIIAFRFLYNLVNG